MKKIWILILLFSCISSPILGAASDRDLQQIHFRNVKVIDGDTFRANEGLIRLWGIDAPEKGHPMYQKSKLLLETIIGNSELTCVLQDRDRYNRLVMKCFSGGFDIASEMVQLGLASDYELYSGGYYHFEEEGAKNNKLNIWAMTNDGK